MKGPGDKMMTDQKKRDTGTHSFTADTDGRYTYCFSNEMSTVTGKTVRSVEQFALRVVARGSWKRGGRRRSRCSSVGSAALRSSRSWLA